jgi:hypothetical protein
VDWENVSGNIIHKTHEIDANGEDRTAIRLTGLKLREDETVSGMREKRLVTE